MNKKLTSYIMLALTIGLFFVYIKPTYNNSVTTLQNKLFIENTTIASTKRYVKKETVLDKERNNISSKNTQRLSKMIPPTNNNVKTLLDLNSLALRNGFYITGFDVGNQINTSQRGGAQTTLYRSVNLKISGTGSYDSFRQFLDGVERSLRLIDVTNVTIKNSNVTGVATKAQEHLTYGITMRLYWLPSNTTTSSSL